MYWLKALYEGQYEPEHNNPLHPFLVTSSHLLGHDGAGIAADTHVGSGMGRAVREGVGIAGLSLGVLVTRQGYCCEGLRSCVKEQQQ